MSDIKPNISSSQSAAASSQPASNELDLTNAGRGVWLVKVPKYIAMRWEKASARTEIGKLQISKGAGGKAEIKFNLSEELIKIPVNNDQQQSSSTPATGTGGKQTSKSASIKNGTQPSAKMNSSNAGGVKANLLNQASETPTALGVKRSAAAGPKNSLIGTKKETILPKEELTKDIEIPREHQFAISDISHQHLAVFSQHVDERGAKKLTLEGNVVQKGECRPIGDDRYMDLKKQSIVQARQPTRQVQQLERAVVNYKPLSAQRAETEPKRKDEQKKSRDDRHKVTEMLFAAFEKHQYYYLKDLVKITAQPVSYVKELLHDIGSYNTKNPHKNMWELKPEYRHYKPSSS